MALPDNSPESASSFIAGWQLVYLIFLIGFFVFVITLLSNQAPPSNGTTTPPSAISDNTSTLQVTETLTITPSLTPSTPTLTRVTETVPISPSQTPTERPFPPTITPTATPIEIGPTSIASSTSTATSDIFTPTSEPIIGRNSDNNVNVRSGPSIAYDRIGSLSENEVVTILGQAPNGEWLEVQLANGEIGWVATRFIVTSTEDQLPIPTVIVSPTPVLDPCPISITNPSDGFSFTSNSQAILSWTSGLLAPNDFYRVSFRNLDGIEIGSFQTKQTSSIKPSNPDLVGWPHPDTGEWVAGISPNLDFRWTVGVERAGRILCEADVRSLHWRIGP
jgi:hypothetical protein